MKAMVQCMSHSPILGYFDPKQDVLDEVNGNIAKARKRILDFDPELIICFSPDHLNGFFYDLMPCFCLCMKAYAIGDYKSMAGDLPVPQDEARDLAHFVLKHGIDLAVSHQMQVDHGMAQPLEQIFGGLDRVPILPIFVNGFAPPLPSFKRVRLLGEAVGKFAKILNRRTLFLASGGLSHEPPLPKMESVKDPEVLKFLLGGGRNLSPEGRNARQERVINGAKRFTEDPNYLHPLNPFWDKQYMNMLEQGAFDELDALSNEEVTHLAGGSTHEAKSWLAAYSALAQYGEWENQERYYRDIHEWIIGYGLLTAQTR